MTAPKRSAVDRAVDEIEAVRRFWYPLPAPARLELEALDADLLQELANTKQPGPWPKFCPCCMAAFHSDGTVTPAEQDTPPHTISERGFIQFDYIDLGDERRVRVYESSAASEARVWLRLVDDEGMACSQLTLVEARQLAAQLAWLTEHHHMAAAVDEEVDRLTDAAADHADTMVDRYDPDDRQPMGGDPYWSEEPTWD